MNAYHPFKPAVKKSARVKRFHDWTRKQPCVVTGRWDGVTLHHVSAHAEGGRFTRSHWCVVPLVGELHQHIHDSRNSVEAIGHGNFADANGVDLERAALWHLIHWLETEDA